MLRPVSVFSKVGKVFGEEGLFRFFLVVQSSSSDCIGFVQGRHGDSSGLL